MLNVIWAVIITVSTLYAIFNGNAGNYTLYLYDGVESAVELCISLFGIMALWGGLMEIGERSGITSVISKLLSPFIRWLFPEVSDSKSKNAISMNITANMLGLGNAATPLGVEAMKRLHTENGNSATASRSMVTFVIINTASVQLVPVTTAVLRAKYGSASPMSILPAVLAASVSALAAGLVADFLIRRVTEKKQYE